MDGGRKCPNLTNDEVHLHMQSRRELVRIWSCQYVFIFVAINYKILAYKSYLRHCRSTRQRRVLFTVHTSSGKQVPGLSVRSKMTSSVDRVFKLVKSGINTPLYACKT